MSKISQTTEKKNNLYIFDVSGTLVKSDSFRKDFSKAFVVYGTEYYQNLGLSKNIAEKKINDGIKLQQTNPSDDKYLKIQDEVGAYATKKGKFFFDIHYDAAMAIKELVEKGHKVVVYSMGLKKSLKPLFESLKMYDGKTLDDYISGYFSSFDIGSKKDPKSFEKILVKMNFPRQRTIYIDDEPENAKVAAQKVKLKKVYNIIRNEQTNIPDNHSKDGYIIIKNLRDIVSMENLRESIIYLVDDSSLIQFLDQETSENTSQLENIASEEVIENNNSNNDSNNDGEDSGGESQSEAA